jgi:hypothetical protein
MTSLHMTKMQQYADAKTEVIADIMKKAQAPTGESNSVQPEDDCRVP